MATISNSGPIVLILTLYQLYGLILGFAIKRLFWLPHRFRYGIYVAAGWGNYGDIRQSHTRYRLFRVLKPFPATASIMSIMTTAPFRGQADIDLGVAYISIVVIFFMVHKNILYSQGLTTRPHAGLPCR